MALRKFGFIIASPEFGPEPQRTVVSAGSFEMIVVGTSAVAQGPPIAKNLVDEGIQLIELCGAFGPIWTAKVIEAIDDAVPVGFVAYGAEAISPMHRLFE